MGSIDTPPTSSAENDSTLTATFSGNRITPESDAMKKRKASILPLDVGTRVMCRWRDGKLHPVKVIERRKMHIGGPNDYEYYVHYTECKILSSVIFC